MNELKFAIPQDILTATIEAMRDLEYRYQAESAAFAQIAGECPEARTLAKERSESAAVASGLFAFYLGL